MQVICDQIKLKSILLRWNSRKQTDSHLLAISSLPSETLCNTYWSHDCCCNTAKILPLAAILQLSEYARSGSIAAIQEVFHVYLNKFENAITHSFLVIFGNN